MSKNNQYKDKVSTQIAVYKTDKQLLELSHKLKRAGWKYPAKIHASGDETEDRNRSLIGLNMLDYSAGAGEGKTISVFFNLSPEQIRYLYSRISVPINNFDFQKEKIFGTPDENGLELVTKLHITQYAKDKEGKLRTYPWFVTIENGKGRTVRTALGGTYCAKGSFVLTGKVGIYLKDEDWFVLLCKAVSLIDAFEKEYAYWSVRSKDYNILYSGLRSEVNRLALLYRKEREKKEIA